MATNHNHLAAVRLFIERGSDVRWGNDQAIINAIHNKNIPMIQLLIDAGVDLKNPRQDILYGAVRSENMELLRFLLVNGITAKDKGRNAISLAIQQDMMDTVELLIHFELPLEIAIDAAEKYVRPHIMEWLQNIHRAMMEKKILEQVPTNHLPNKVLHRI